MPAGNEGERTGWFPCGVMTVIKGARLYCRGTPPRATMEWTLDSLEL